MDAIVLAGGYATRLWPLTRDRPKMLLPIGDTTVIDRILSNIEADDRISTVYVSTNAAFADEFASYLAASEFTKPQLSVEETVEEAEKFGVVGALGQLVEREGIDDDLLVIAGDNLFSFDISTFIDYFETVGEPTLAAYDVGSTAKASSYGLVELEGDRVVDFQEKPDDPNSTLVSTACYGFPKDSIRFAEYLNGNNNPDEPGWFLQWLQTRETVRAFTFDDAWFDIGDLSGYLEAVEWVLDGGTAISSTATLEDVDLGSGVQVLSGATVENASLERTVVFPDVHIADATLTDTVVDVAATVEGLELAETVVGAYSTIR